MSKDTNVDDDSRKILQKSAEQKLTKYKLGGNWDSEETDCSGTLTNILHKAGLRDAYEQGRLNSSMINSKNGFHKVNELAPGDILVWKGHVAIYAGNDRIYTTSNTGNSFKLVQIKHYWGSKTGFVGGYQYVGN